MDYLKVDDDREINHHGTSRPVAGEQEDTEDKIVVVAPASGENIQPSAMYPSDKYVFHINHYSTFVT
jgi:hypothetical protein